MSFLSCSVTIILPCNQLVENYFWTVSMHFKKSEGKERQWHPHIRNQFEQRVCRFLHCDTCTHIGKAANCYEICTITITYFISGRPKLISMWCAVKRLTLLLWESVT